MSSPLRRLCNRVGVVLGALLAVSVPVSCGGSSQTASTAGSQNGTTTAKSATATSATGAHRGPADHRHPRSGADHIDIGRDRLDPPHPASPSPNGRLLHRFTGYWQRAAGHDRAARSQPAVVACSQPHIQIFTANGFMLVNSRSTTGSVRVSRGTYRGVRVASAGALVGRTAARPPEPNDREPRCSWAPRCRAASRVVHASKSGLSAGDPR